MEQASAQQIAGALRLIGPEVCLIAAACAMFLVAPFRGGRSHSYTDCCSTWAYGALLALFLAAACWLTGPALTTSVATAELFASPLRFDGLAWLVKGIGLATGAILVLLVANQRLGALTGEYMACLLLIIAGVNLVGSANDLVMLFLALELISIPTYILLYLSKTGAAAQEATTKYFLLSVFASALFLFGLSYLFGAVGSTNFEVLRSTLQQVESERLVALLFIALVTIAAGLGFRITAVPFHFYAPDVFQGTSNPAAALLSFVPKVAGFVALYRLAVGVLPVDGIIGAKIAGATAWLFLLLSIVTMFLGNLLALLQTNLRRLLAYSSIAHAGYMLVALSVGQGSSAVDGGKALFFYLIVYGAMTLGAFSVIIYLDRPDRQVETVDDLAGLAKSHPAISLLMAVFCFSLTGLPPTAGFWGKLFLFLAAWSQGSPLYRTLAIMLAVNAAIGAWYYLRIVSAMYLGATSRPLDTRRSWASLSCVSACAVVTLGLFVLPSLLWKFVERAAG